MATPTATTGMNCPNCGGQLQVPEGRRIVACPFCQMRSLVAGERGVYRYQVARRVERSQAEAALRGLFTGVNKAFDLQQHAQVRELFVVYLPYWRARAQLAGWIFGKVRRGSGKNSRLEPVEVRVDAPVSWNDAACDVTEFGVQSLTIDASTLAPYEPEALRADGMVFEPVESASEALDQAHEDFARQARATRSLAQKSYELFHYLDEQLSIVFYPLWIARYEYRGRMYQAIVDGVQPRVLYGKAPGNIFYRAAMLVGGMLAGNCLLVNGTLLALELLGSSNSHNDDSFFIVCIPPVLGAVLIWAGYRLFRYGEEIEQRDRSVNARRPDSQAQTSVTSVMRSLSDVQGSTDLDGLFKMLTKL
jgi:DNA-directed RNA polymerase subunit RPC12/RpoP